MNEELEESPYCEVCGHCGYIDCCGIVNFLEEHVKDKTNCKNESGIIQEIKDICKYETSVFKENDNLNKGIDELIEKYEDKIAERTKRIEHFKTKNEKEMVIMNRQAKFDYEQFLNKLKKLKGE